MNECFIFLCNNGGICVNIDGSFYCVCFEVWIGEVCDVDVNECENDFCLYGNCINYDGYFFCVCIVGWFGIYCDVDVDECISGLCLGIVICKNKDGSFIC